MLDRLVTVTNTIYIASDRDTLFKAVEAGCSSFGFDIFRLSCHKSSKQEVILNSTLNNLPKGFLSDYEGFQWSEDDFILECIMQEKSSFAWNTGTTRYENIRKQSFIDFMAASQLLTGVGVPLAARPETASSFAVVSSNGGPVCEGLVQAATIIGNAAMTKAEILGLCPEVSRDAAKAARALTPIQKEILSWIAEGKSNLDISTITGLNERAVRYHVTEILRKLGVATRAQAAAIRRTPGFDYAD